MFVRTASAFFASSSMTASRCTVASRCLFVLARCSYRGSSGIYSSLLAPDRVSMETVKAGNRGGCEILSRLMASLQISTGSRTPVAPISMIFLAINSVSESLRSNPIEGCGENFNFFRFQLAARE